MTQKHAPGTWRMTAFLIPEDLIAHKSDLREEDIAKDLLEVIRYVTEKCVRNNDKSVTLGTYEIEMLEAAIAKAAAA